MNYEAQLDYLYEMRYDAEDHLYDAERECVGDMEFWMDRIKVINQIIEVVINHRDASTNEVR